MIARVRDTLSAAPSAQPPTARIANIAPGESKPFRIVAAFIGVLVAASVVVERGLYAGGSFYLVGMLEQRRFVDFDDYRRHAQLITQAPVILALKLGAHNLHALILAHSFGLLGLPAFFWLLGLYRIRDDEFFWPMVLAFAVVYLNSSVMAIGEFNLAYGVAGCALATLLRLKPLTFGDGVLLNLLAIVATRTYEAMVFIAPVLGLLCLYRMAEASRERRPAATGALALAAVWFIVATVVSVESLQHFRDQSNLASARNLSAAIQNGQLMGTTSCAALYALLFALRRVRTARIVAAMLAVGPIVLLLTPALWAQPPAYHAARVVVGLFLAALGGCLALERIRMKPFPRRLITRSWALASLPVGTLLVLSFLDGRHTLQFNAFRNCFEGEVNARSGFVRLEGTRLRTDRACRDRYGWPWAYPSISLLLREDASKAIILNPHGDSGWQPFDPRVALPDLSAYYSR